MYLVFILMFIGIMGLVIWLLHLRQKISLQSIKHETEIDSDERFRLLLQNMVNVSVQGYDQNRRVNFWNKASEHLYGYSGEEAKGQLLEDLIIPEHLRDFVVETTDAWLSGGKEIPAGELVLKTKTGQPVSVYSSHVMSHTHDGKPEMYCIDIDLTAHKQDKQDIQQAKKNFDILFNLRQYPIYFIILINRSF